MENCEFHSESLQKRIHNLLNETKERNKLVPCQYQIIRFSNSRNIGFAMPSSMSVFKNDQIYIYHVYISFILRQKNKSFDQNRTSSTNSHVILAYPFLVSSCNFVENNRRPPWRPRVCDVKTHDVFHQSGDVYPASTAFATKVLIIGAKCKKYRKVRCLKIMLSYLSYV